MGSYFLNHFTHWFYALRNPGFRIAFCVPQQRGHQPVTFVNLLLIARMPGLQRFNALSHGSNEVKTKTCQPWGRGEIIREGWRSSERDGEPNSPGCWLPGVQWLISAASGWAGLPGTALLLLPLVSQGTAHLHNALLGPGPSWEEQRCRQQELTSLDEQTLNRSPAPRI